MIDFKCPRLEDASWARELLMKERIEGCEYSFGNIVIWSRVYCTHIAKYDDWFLARDCRKDGKYGFPRAGQDLKKMVEILIEDAHKLDRVFVMYGLTRTDVERLEKVMPDTFRFEDYRDGFDYVYFRSDLAELKGKKYHSKRNHISYFERENDGRWQYEEITRDNIDDCIAMDKQWLADNIDKDESNIADENIAVNLALDNYFELNLRGGLIRLDGKVIAFTFGERLNDDTFCTHVEKAYADIRGAYPLINREFARNTLTDYFYVNREEDTGAEGLRKAKLSYNPAFLVEKFTASLIEDM